MTGDSRLAIVMSAFEGVSRGLTLGEIRTRTGLGGGTAEAVDELVETGMLRPLPRGRFATSESLGLLRGRIRVRTSGFGVVFAGGVRLVVEPRDLGGAIDGDWVLVREAGLTDRSEARGRVTAVLSGSREGAGGVARKAGRGWVLDPLDPALPRGIPLDIRSTRSPVEGKVVWGRFDRSGHVLSAVLEDVLGADLTPAVAIDSVVRDMGIPSGFPDPVLEEASASASAPVGPDGREDFRSVLCFTIDPVDARDFDDAVSIEATGSGYRLGVHIADVAAYVRPGSALDAEASARLCSVYLPDRVLPMLPEALSAGACSLRPGEDRLARSVLLDFDRSGRRTGYRITPSIIRSRARLTYEQAFAIMGGEPAGVPGVEPALLEMTGLSRLLDRERESRGALDLGGEEYRIGFDASGWPASFEPVPDDESHRLIENFMVEANRAVAEHCSWLGLQVLFRVHGAPDRDAAVRLRGELSELGMSLPASRAFEPGDLSSLIASARGTPSYTLVREAVLKSLQRAVYSPDNLGHFGLALRSYLHFTSPIRRYPDLLVHRSLEVMDAGGRMSLDDPAGMAEACSELEQRAEEAERECTGLMALMHLERRRGAVFDGVVSGVQTFGVFVRLQGVPIEGMIPARAVPALLMARARPGLPVRVQIEAADPGLRQLTLRPVT